MNPWRPWGRVGRAAGLSLAHHWLRVASTQIGADGE